MVKIRKRTKHQFTQAYEDMADIYDKDRSQTFLGKMIDKLQIEFIYKSLNLKKGMKVLEAGCGTGRILIPLAKKGIDCYGIDPSSNMLNVLKDKIKNPNLNISIKKGDIERIPYPDNFFDGVYTMHVLMHMQNHEKAIKEIYRVLKPGRRMIADFPNKNSPYTKLSILLNPKEVRTGLYSKRYLKHLFKNYNYSITGLFSYSKIVYQFPVIRHLFYILEKIIKLPVGLRSQLVVIVKK